MRQLWRLSRRYCEPRTSTSDPIDLVGCIRTSTGPESSRAIQNGPGFDSPKSLDGRPSRIDAVCFGKRARKSNPRHRQTPRYRKADAWHKSGPAYYGAIPLHPEGLNPLSRYGDCGSHTILPSVLPAAYLLGWEGFTDLSRYMVRDHSRPGQCYLPDKELRSRSTPLFPVGVDHLFIRSFAATAA